MRVLGIDPGSRFTGFGVVEERGNRLAYVGHGIIRLDPRDSLAERLGEIFEGLRKAAEVHRPDAVAVEGIFTFRNARSALVLGHARGVALLMAAQRDLPVHEYSPARVKKAVGAGGASGKDAVARMVRTFLGVSGLERADASDALAVAICHLNHSGAVVGGSRTTRRPKARAFASLGGRLRPSYERAIPSLMVAGHEDER